MPAFPRVFVDELSRQTTFEFRATSPDLPGFLGLGTLVGLPLGSTDFTSGFFFQRRTQTPTTGGADIDAPLVLAVAALDGRADTPPLPGPPSGMRPMSVDVEHGLTRFEEKSNRFAGFGQMNWRFTDRWTLLYGMRLDHATKDVSWFQTFEPDTAVVAPQTFPKLTAEDSLAELQFAPKVGMKFDWTEDVDLYWNWSRNFQAGGFNNFAVSTDPALRRVDAASVRSWEAGTKLRLLDGAAELNLGLFWMTMSDFQLFTQAPMGLLNVPEIVNVGELRARGVESDVAWLPTDWLTLRGTLGFNDTKFLDFPIGTCFSDKPNTDGDADPRCDLTGRSLPQAPKWNIGMTPSVRVPLTSIPGLRGPASFLRAIDLTSALTVRYVDTRFLSDTLDPRTRQPSFFLLDGSIGFGNASQGWSLQFRVENLTDKTTADFSRESGLPSGIAFTTLAPPRLMFGQFRWEF
jgi:iron complex outermembrane receptor protein